MKYEFSSFCQVVSKKTVFWKLRWDSNMSDIDRKVKGQL